MGFKERLSSTASGKPLMGTFFAFQLMDVVMTKADLTFLSGTEINPFGAELLQNMGRDDAFALKIALSAVIVGSYALASIHEKDIKIGPSNIRLKHATEKSLQAATIFMAGVTSWNAVNLGLDVVSKIQF